MSYISHAHIVGERRLIGHGLLQRLPPIAIAHGALLLVMFVAGRRPLDFLNQSIGRIHGQSRAKLESSRARAPYTARRKLSGATVLRAAALPSKWTRSLAAYSAEQPAHQHRTIFLSLRGYRRTTGQLGRRRLRPLRKNQSSRATQRIVDAIPAIGRTCEYRRSTRAANGCLKIGLCLHGRPQIATDDSTTRTCPSLMPRMLPDCSRPPSLSTRSKIYSVKSSDSNSWTMPPMRPGNFHLGRI